MLFDISIMGARLNATNESFKIINEFGVWFMQYSENILTPVEGVNVGFLIIFPILSLIFDIDISQSVNLFFNFFFIFGFIWSLYFFVKITTTNYLRFFLIFLILSFSFNFVAEELFDLVGEYSLYFVSPIMLIPYFYYLKENKNITSKFILITILFISFLGIIFGLIKDYSMVGAILFGLILLFNIKRYRIFLISSLFLVILIPNLVLKFVESKQIINYQNIYNAKPEIDYLIGASPYHSFYSGLGFTTNKYVKEFTDEAAAELLRKKNKNYKIFHTKENEKILKNEIINIFKKDKNFILRNIFSKIGVIFMWVLTFANIGLLYFFIEKIKFSEFLSYFAAISFYSIFPIITIPTTFYMMGIFSISISIFILFVINFEKMNFLKKIKFTK